MHEEDSREVRIAGVLRIDPLANPTYDGSTLRPIIPSETNGGQTLGGSSPGVSVILPEERVLHLVGDLTPKTILADQVPFGPGSFSVIAGPCAVESEEQLIASAQRLRTAGAVALRGGAFKPRTSPYSFSGLGAAGLEALSAAREASGLAIVTELLDPRDAELVADTADMVQIGSRNMSNYPLLREVGQLGKPVLLKRGMSATVEEFLFAAEHVAAGGSDQIVLCERGLRHFDSSVRNLLDLSVVPVLRERTGLPVVVDPSHAAGRAALVPPLMSAAAAVGADGLLVEVHPAPADSISDPDQALDFATFAEAMFPLPAILAAVGRNLHS